MKMNSRKLYIIGNGFDLAHGLKTSYWDFRTFLENKHPSFLRKFENLYDIQPLDDTEPSYTLEAQRRWDEEVNYELWSQFENAIGEPNIAEMEDMSECVAGDLGLETDDIGIKDTMDIYWKEEYGFINNMQEYVQEWISQNDLGNIVPQKKELIAANDNKYINFNYTNTLEVVYKIKSVLHIHGGLYPYSDISPILGHCNSDAINLHRQEAGNAEDNFDEANESIHNAIADYLIAVYKDTNKIIDQHKRFFETLKDIKTVVILGWSAGEVDLPYLKKIAESVSETTEWEIYYYDDATLKTLRNAFLQLNIEERFPIKYLCTTEFWDR